MSYFGYYPKPKPQLQPQPQPQTFRKKAVNLNYSSNKDLKSDEKKYTEEKKIDQTKKIEEDEYDPYKTTDNDNYDQGKPYEDNNYDRSKPFENDNKYDRSIRNEDIICDRKKNNNLRDFRIALYIVLALIVVALIITVSIMLSIILTTPKSYGNYCTSNSDCIMSLGISCVSNICSCPSGYYFTGFSCDTKLKYNITCMYSNQCDSTVGLSCDKILRTCGCTFSNYTWNGDTCIDAATATTTTMSSTT